MGDARRPEREGIVVLLARASDSMLFSPALMMAFCISVCAMASGGDPMKAGGREAFEKDLADAVFVKEGMDRLHRMDYQYESIGLAGTTMRPGPYGFTSLRPPALPSDGTLDNRPYLVYEYWWDENSHRVVPFDLLGGYGDKVEAGEITGFRHALDIRTGVLSIHLELKTSSGTFQSTRELFVTPQGVLAVRVTDSQDCPAPFRLRVLRREVWPRGFFGIICSDYPEPRGAVQQGATPGLVVAAERSGACKATLAVAVDAANAEIDAGACTAGRGSADRLCTYFIAPGSSLDGAASTRGAWEKAEEAAAKGFDALRSETEAWWREYYDQSWVTVPDERVARWFARSLYYHGVYFGKTQIPPGCFSTNPAGFLGTICPEFDLPFSQFALLYTNHAAEAESVADWCVRILPQARKNALGTTLHKTTVSYTSGALYGPLMGWDGRLFVPPTEGEGIHAYEKYPNANVAGMVLAYLDWTGDASYRQKALTILKDTAQVVFEDLVWDAQAGRYVDRYLPHGLNAAAAEYLLRQAVERGAADDGWAERLENLEQPTGTYHGREVLGAGRHEQNSGDAPWLQPLWWYGNVSPDDPRVKAAYDMIRHSKTGRYVFNNGWMSVLASKLGLSNDALGWVRNLAAPGPGVPNPIFDDTNFSEHIVNVEDERKTPEIAAHAALICAVVQMLLDPDDGDTLRVFPAVPEPWFRKGVAFENLRVHGNLFVSGALSDERIAVRVDNRSDHAQARQVWIRIPEGRRAVPADQDRISVSEGWARRDVELAAGASESIRLTLDAERADPAS